MPSRNVIREFASDNYYHIYNRGVAKQEIFLEAADKQKFLDIIARHLDPSDTSTRYDGVEYCKFDQDIELLCYCLMRNHFHMLVYLVGDTGAVSELMRSIQTAYTMYFNKKYKRVGTLFQGVFKASRISDESYLQHITRYIHLNPRTYKTYHYSSLRFYLGAAAPLWLRPERMLGSFEEGEYIVFLEDYEAEARIRDTLKCELADI